MSTDSSAAGARVLVPSRSPEKIDHLQGRLGPEASKRFIAVPGDVGAVEGAASLGGKVRELTDRLVAVAAAPASWHQNQSMLQAGFADFKHVIETRLYPHYLAVETFLPLLDPSGSYTTINGPAGFAHSPLPGTGVISVAAAAQGVLTQAFAREVDDHPRVNDVVMHAYLGPQGTRRNSPLQGEQVDDYVAALTSHLGAEVHGQTLHLQEPADRPGPVGHLHNYPLTFTPTH